MYLTGEGGLISGGWAAACRRGITRTHTTDHMSRSRALVGWFGEQLAAEIITDTFL